MAVLALLVECEAVAEQMRLHCVARGFTLSGEQVQAIVDMLYHSERCEPNPAFEVGPAYDTPDIFMHLRRLAKRAGFECSHLDFLALHELYGRLQRITSKMYVERPGVFVAAPRLTVRNMVHKFCWWCNSETFMMSHEVDGWHCVSCNQPKEKVELKRIFA